jgi:hypothetical protein
MTVGLQPKLLPGVTVSEGVVASIVQVYVADPVALLPLHESVATTVKTLVWMHPETESEGVTVVVTLPQVSDAVNWGAVGKLVGLHPKLVPGVTESNGVLVSAVQV